jgi:phage shock protein A|tara:strand:- start:18 stop:287 length:270 start_codon:yes stop_codon:yes gene_type:complete
MKDDRGHSDLTRQIEELKKKVREAEGETSLVKAIGINSPEMKALKKENEELKAQLARAKEDHQYDNLVHKKELESLKNPVPDLRKKGLM